MYARRMDRACHLGATHGASGSACLGVCVNGLAISADDCSVIVLFLAYFTWIGRTTKAAPARLSWTTAHRVPSEGSYGARYSTSLSVTRPTLVSKRRRASSFRSPRSE